MQSEQDKEKGDTVELILGMPPLVSSFWRSTKV